ncbi:MAG TPA: acyl-CoA carboxylase epsilon subunit [Dermatophilaceae bacterium]|nr:acyl-CoA carboxylase epsilon subunit [Dermatophilaceae bacterium]
MTTTPDALGEAPVAPVIRVLHGSPTPDEIAVVVAVLSAAGGGDTAAEPAPPSRWSAPASRLGQLAPGRGSWRFSGLIGR